MPGGSTITSRVTKTSPNSFRSRDQRRSAQHRHAARGRDDLLVRLRARSWKAPSRTVLWVPWKSDDPVTTRPSSSASARISLPLARASGPRGPPRARTARPPASSSISRSGTTRPRLVARGWAKTGTPPAARTARTASKTSRSAFGTKYRAPSQRDANASSVVRTRPARISACAMCGRPTEPPAAYSRTSAQVIVARRPPGAGRRSARRAAPGPRAAGPGRRPAAVRPDRTGTPAGAAGSPAARRTTGRRARRRGPGADPPAAPAAAAAHPPVVS